MKEILGSLKSEFITIHDDAKSYTVRFWHVLVAVSFVSWLIG